MASAGERNTQVTLQKPTYTISTSGDQIVTWVTVGTWWIWLEWQSGRRFEEAKKINAQISGVGGGPYRTDVRADWRLKYGNRYMYIDSLSDYKERRIELRLNLKELQT